MFLSRFVLHLLLAHAEPAMLWLPWLPCADESLKAKGFDRAPAGCGDWRLCSRGLTREQGHAGTHL